MSETLSIWSSKAWDGWNAPVSTFWRGILAAVGGGDGVYVRRQGMVRGLRAVGRAAPVR